MHPFQILGNPVFQSLVQSGVIHVHVSKSTLFLSHNSGCYVCLSFRLVSAINSNGITTTIECGQCWVSVWQSSGFFSVSY